ncbi:MAG: hypothetical protein OEQ13_08930 [Acidobacteriota bacterium]|nr:hypothetical protein [Acidobacteriota bacterium]
MELAQLEQILDEKGIGDPGVVERLDEAVQDFREEVFGTEELDEGFVYMIGIASLFRDDASAYDLLHRMRAVIEREGPGRMSELYEEQLKVWKQRRDKSQHDIQYLRIVLGVKQGPLEQEVAAHATTEEIAEAPFLNEDVESSEES